MRYTRQTIQKLDPATIDFCCRWVWDSLKRARMIENNGRTKAAREYAHDSNNGTEFAFDMLRMLKKHNASPENLADEFSLLDDDMRE